MYVLKDVLQKYDLQAKKSLGQNFILDGNLLHKIARTALVGLSPSVVLEVGPGPGGLTQALLEEGVPRLVAVEKDRRCVAALAELKADYPQQLQVLNEDALLFDEQTLGPDICVVANLPYNVSTVLLVKWLKQIKRFSRLTLMFQKEVAERLTARENDAAYGRLSVLTGWLADVSIEMAPLADVSFQTMERVTAAAFGQRRKMLRSSLKSLGDPVALCAAAGVPVTDRAENVPVDGFCKMAAFLEKMEK